MPPPAPPALQAPVDCTATAMPAAKQSPADVWWEECKAAAAQRGRGEDCILPVAGVEAEDEEAGPTLAEFRAT